MSPIHLVPHHFQARVTVAGQHIPCVIRRCIVDCDDLERIISLLGKNTVQAIGEISAVIETGHNEAHLRFGDIHLVRSAIRAGTPTAVTCGGMSETTAAPAPITDHAPILMRSLITAPAPINAPSPMVTEPQIVAPGLILTKSPMLQSCETDAFTFKMQCEPIAVCAVTIAPGARQVP